MHPIKYTQNTTILRDSNSFNRAYSIPFIHLAMNSLCTTNRTLFIHRFVHSSWSRCRRVGCTRRLILMPNLHIVLISNPSGAHWAFAPDLQYRLSAQICWNRLRRFFRFANGSIKIFSSGGSFSPAPGLTYGNNTSNQIFIVIVRASSISWIDWNIHAVITILRDKRIPRRTRLRSISCCSIRCTCFRDFVMCWTYRISFMCLNIQRRHFSLPLGTVSPVITMKSFT